MIAKPDGPAYNKAWPLLHFLVYLRDILAQYAEDEEKDSEHQHDE
jgi:hypothetical protein